MERVKRRGRKGRPQETKALRYVEGLLEEGGFPPGTRLPSERDLAEAAGVCRVTVRRVMAKLIQAGRVQPRLGSGTFVTVPSRSTQRNVVSLMYTQREAIPESILEQATAAPCELSVYTQAEFHWHPEAELAFLRRVRDERHRGLLAFCTPLKPRNNRILRDLATTGVRILHIEHNSTALPEQAYVMPDFRRAGHMAATDLMIAGYQNLLYLGYRNQKAPFEKLMMQGFSEALEEHRPDLDPAEVFRDYPTGLHQEEKLLQVVENLPPKCGVVVHVASQAVKFKEYVKRSKRKCPEDVGIIGMDVASAVAKHPEADVDVLYFDRPALLKRALNAVLAREWNPPRELTMPSHIKNGTVK